MDYRYPLYIKMKAKVSSLPERAGHYLPSLEDIRGKIEKSPEQYADYIIWCLETVDKPVPQELQAQYRRLESVIKKLDNTHTGLAYKGIDDAYITLEEYAKMCDSFREMPGFKWPSLQTVEALAQKSFSGNLSRFAYIDEFAPSPKTVEEKAVKDYVKQLLKEHLVFRQPSLDPIPEIRMSFERYSELCDAVLEKNEKYKWPKVAELKKMAHLNFGKYIMRFIELDECGEKPKTQDEAEAKRYVRAVLTNCLVFQPDDTQESDKGRDVKSV